MTPLPLPVLNHRFRNPDAYESKTGVYALLPFRFLPLDLHRYILTNFVGEHMVLHRDIVHRLIRHTLGRDESVYDALKSRHFILDDESTVAIDLVAAKYRTKQAFLKNFTSLFMFVTTLRCDHSCQYCQVSRQSEDRLAYDMSMATADRAIDFMFKTPSPSIKVEFQGGESLLNFELIRHIVLQVQQRNMMENKDIAFVVATNLAPLTDEHLIFFRKHSVSISTSLDGPPELHNRNRPRPGKDSHQRAIDGIRRARAALDHDKVAALMTTTAASLAMPDRIIDEYVKHGFTSIFLRAISPYGHAVRTGEAVKYRATEWLDFYKAGLGHILALNHRGIPMREEYASIVLRKILTPYPTGYVDLQSPAGIGISGIVFNYDGDVYASDESRMLAEMGDKKFRLGSLHTDSYEGIMLSDALIEPLQESIAESVPMCADCALLPYCGSDPVQHYATQGDVVGFKPTSEFCRRNMGVIRHLITLLEDDPHAANILRSWGRW